ncbi:vascular cell adhesion protein 1-like [Antennarius striatus]|uniref:vascular cell adhesion protein 1-like n=1 Tax=Antennarius striatus TaxID=241820 RepID=UPI0035AD821B
MEMRFYFFTLLLVSWINLHAHLAGADCDENCPDKPVFTPSRLVVRHGAPTSASCAVCEQDCLNGLFNLEKSLGVSTKNGTTISWTVDRMTEWDMLTTCYYNNIKNGQQCCTILPITVYQPPEAVSLSVSNHSGVLFEGQLYTLQCSVQDVAPVGNLTVTFYRGQRSLGQLRSEDHTSKKPVTETFDLPITPSPEDDGGQFWCEAKLDFGVEGPQRPPVVISQNFTATVHYAPQLEVPSKPYPIIIPEGNRLQLNCSAVGNPDPSYSWTVPSDELDPSNHSTFIISAIKPAHKGHYTCFVSNSVGNFSVEFSVEVQVSYTVYIIAAVIVVAAIFITLGVILYRIYHKRYRTGDFSPWKNLRSRVRHRSVPTAE